MASDCVAKMPRVFNDYLDAKAFIWKQKKVGKERNREKGKGEIREGRGRRVGGEVPKHSPTDLADQYFLLFSNRSQKHLHSSS